MIGTVVMVKETNYRIFMLIKSQVETSGFTIYKDKTILTSEKKLQNTLFLDIAF